MRIDQAKKDTYRKIAKSEGYKSRAVYKLIQINKKYRFLRRNDIVIDFGCAPGGWLQYISNIIGPLGFCLGIDLKPVGKIADNICTILADIKDLDILEKINKKLKNKADVITSDISQNLSGIWELDVAKQIDLTLRIINSFPYLLKKGGSSFLKVFQGEQLNDLLNKLKNNFKFVVIVKPPASRPQSSELYLLCRNYIG